MKKKHSKSFVALCYRNGSLSGFGWKKGLGTLGVKYP